jgi:hypothetical protein
VLVAHPVEQEAERHVAVDQAVAVDAAEVVARAPRQPLRELGPHRVAVVQPPDLVREVAAAVGEDDLEARVPLEDPTEDQPRDRERRLRREPDQVPEVQVLEPPDVPGVLRVQEERHAEPLCRRPDRVEARVVQVHPVDVRADLRTPQAELADRARQLPGGPRAVLHGERRQPEQPVRVRADE